jgi:hypothetical protein
VDGVGTTTIVPTITIVILVPSNDDEINNPPSPVTTALDQSSVRSASTLDISTSVASLPSLPELTY